MKEKCRKHLEKLSEYLDGNLEKALCEEIEDHQQVPRMHELP